LAETPTQTDYDAVVVGAGFAGIYMLYKLREELGLSVRVFDKASGVGGTWHWNRYPGAMSDSHTHVYCYSFDKELLQDRDITTKYVKQPQVLEYLEHVVERHDLAKDIQLNTGMTGASFDEKGGVWHVRLDTGENVTARFLVTAIGLLSQRNLPDFPGLGSFAGESYHTGAWPEGVDLTGKRVGVIGTGSTGIQVITRWRPSSITSPCSSGRRSTACRPATAPSPPRRPPGSSGTTTRSGRGCATRWWRSASRRVRLRR